MDILATPPLAFVIYIIQVGLLLVIGRFLAGPSHPNPAKSNPYASGEAPHVSRTAPGYRPFFQGALFFAVLHLGVLVLASGEPSTTTVIYLVGLFVALIALILG